MKDVGERLKEYEPLWENWYIDGYIGRGASSTVYRLKQDRFGSTINSAVKVIAINIENENGFDNLQKLKSIQNKRNRAEAEINNMYELNDCPYIVHCNNYAIKEVYDNDNQIGYDILIQMGYYECFSKYLSKNRKFLDEDEVIKLTIQIGNGLKAAHDINIIHRDIKPDNFFIDKRGNYLLGDLGVSKQLTNETSYSTLTGTQPYIAPEIWNVKQTKKYTKTTDIYSFGIVIYTLMNNNLLPFVTANSNANEIQSAIERRLSGERLIPPENASNRFKEIILKACSYESSERYQDMDEFLDDIYALQKMTYEERNYQEDGKKSVYETILLDDDNEKDNNRTYNSLYGSKVQNSIDKKPEDQVKKYVGKQKSNKSKNLIILLIVAICLAAIVTSAILILPKITNENEKANVDSVESTLIVGEEVSSEPEKTTTTTIKTTKKSTTTEKKTTKKKTKKTTKKPVTKKKTQRVTTTTTYYNEPEYTTTWQQTTTARQTWQQTTQNNWGNQQPDINVDNDNIDAPEW